MLPNSSVCHVMLILPPGAEGVVELSGTTLFSRRILLRSKGCGMLKEDVLIVMFYAFPFYNECPDQRPETKPVMKPILNHFSLLLLA